MFRTGLAIDSIMNTMSCLIQVVTDINCYNLNNIELLELLNLLYAGDLIW